jgi:hypothetical protein
MTPELLLPIIPQPRKVKRGQGIATFTPTLKIMVSTTSDAHTYGYCAELLQDKIRNELKRKAPAISVNKKRTEDDTIIILGIPDQYPLLAEIMESRKLPLPNEIGEEGYLLHVHQDLIILAAKTEQGVYYATQTLLQLIHDRNGKFQLPRMTILDKPLFKIRAVSDDISRGQISNMQNFKDIIRQLSMFKINYYMPYIEDMFCFSAFPEIGKNRGALSKAEVKELVEYAHKHHVEIVPIFECLGHQDRILKLPQFNKLAERPEEPWSFCPAVEETYTFLDKCIKELAEVFPSPYFCIGCDETSDLGNHQSKTLAKKIGIDGVFAQHVARVKEILEKYGKQAWMYGDMAFEKAYPKLKDLLSKDIMMVNWIYSPQKEYDRVHDMHKWGFNQVVSPGVHCWGRIFPDIEEGIENAKTLVASGYKHGAIGEIQSSWCDFGGECFREMNWYLYAYSADLGWNPDRKDRRWFDKVYFYQFYGTDNPAVSKIHQLLGQTNRDFKFYYATTALAIWRDHFEPQCTELIKDRKERSRRLAKIINECERLFPEANESVHQHRDHLEIFKLTIERVKLLTLRLQLEEKQAVMDAVFANPTAAMSQKKEAAAVFIEYLQEQRKLLMEIKLAFTRQWLRYHKSPMLRNLLANYDKLNLQLEKMAIDLQQSIKPISRSK